MDIFKKFYFNVLGYSLFSLFESHITINIYISIYNPRLLKNQLTT